MQLRQVKLHFVPPSLSFSHLKTHEIGSVGSVGCWQVDQFMHMFNISCACDNLVCMFSDFIFHVPLKARESDCVGGGMGC